MAKKIVCLGACLGFFCLSIIGMAAEGDSFPPLKDGKLVPQNLEELWGGYDPRKEPLETEILKEWEDDGIVCRIVRYRIGVFKGQKAVMGAIYAFPKGGRKLPGLVQLHGGGQSANLAAATTNARRGYACISLNWGCNALNDGNYRPLWANPVTDWGAVDASHPPQHDPVNHFATMGAPNEFTLDTVESPRNSAVFLVVIAARRALTFLEQQPEVDGDKLGIYGHSMGGGFTVLTAAMDPRVKAAAPSSGGNSHIISEQKLEGRTLADNAYHKRLNCPIIFLTPANDFVDCPVDWQKTVDAMPGKTYRFTSAPNLNHRLTPEYLVCGPLWFDYVLKGSFDFPKTPKCTLDLNGPRGIPVLYVTPDTCRPVESVDVYYTEGSEWALRSAPCWRHVAPSRKGNRWQARLPLRTINEPLWVYANVTYPLDKPVTNVGFYYIPYTAKAFTISSNFLGASTETLQECALKATDKPSLQIENFAKGWYKGWYSLNMDGKEWPYRTNKIKDLKWQGPDGAKLAFEVRSDQPNKLVVELDDNAAEIQVGSGRKWQSVALSAGDFSGGKAPITEWRKLNELVLGFRGAWNGPVPQFRNLRWTPPGE